MNFYFYAKGLFLTLFKESYFPLVKIVVSLGLIILFLLISFLISKLFPKKIKPYIFIICFLLCSFYTYKENSLSTSYVNHNMNLKKDVKIVELTDFHYNTTYNFIINNAIKKCNEENPDIVVLLGDFKTDVSEDDLPNYVYDSLRKIKCKNIYCVWGNHDNFVHKEEIKKKLENMGIVFVHGKKIPISNDLFITGIDFDDIYFKELRKAFKNILPNENIVFLIHSPKFLFEGLYDEKLLKNKNIFFLCGHTHGGQFNYPWRDMKQYSMETNCIPKIDHELNLYGHKVWISRGLGCAYCPLRYRAKPELTVINLK